MDKISTPRLDNIRYVSITPENISQYGVYCIKNKKSQGAINKIKWYKKHYKLGLRLIVAIDEMERQVGFIEYVPVENAWRPILAKNNLFVDCIGIFASKAKGHGIATNLINIVIDHARSKNLDGVCTICSKGPWMSDNNIFLKLGFSIIDSQERYELLQFEVNKNVKPKFIDWVVKRKDLKGLWLYYADQCPWHYKSVFDIYHYCNANYIKINICKIESPVTAQHCPSGFGTYALINDGKLLSDHYISLTRFKNIAKKESLIGN